MKLPDHSEISECADCCCLVTRMAVLTASGDVLASNRTDLVGRNFADREYVKLAVAQADASALYLAPPFKTILNVYSVNLARVRLDSQGKVDRIVSATLDPEFFEILLASVRHRDAGWTALAHSSGRLLLHHPPRPDLLGADLNRPGSFFSRHVASGQPVTFLEGQVATTGEQALMSQHTINPRSLNMTGHLVVSVAVKPSDILQGWHEVLTASVLLWVGFFLASALGLWKFQHERARLILDHAAANGAKVSVGLRINPQVPTGEVAKYDPSAPGSRLGFPLDQLTEEHMEGVEGIHFHNLCEQDFEPLKATWDRVFDVIEPFFGQLKWINMGGGHHVTRADYQREELVEFLRDAKEDTGAEIYLEPGEAVALDAGILVGTVLDLGENGMPVAIVDISATCHMPDVIEAPYRPAMLGELPQVDTDIDEGAGGAVGRPPRTDGALRAGGGGVAGRAGPLRQGRQDAQLHRAGAGPGFAGLVAAQALTRRHPVSRARTGRPGR